jgi:hypothetical protein
MKKYLNDPAYIQKMRDVAPKRTVYQFTLEGDYIAVYESAMEAERQLGISNTQISKSAFGKLPSTGGYIFLFEEDLDKIDLRVDRYKHSKKPRKEHIVQLTLDREFVAEWNGSVDAGNALQIEYKNINAVCRGKRNKAGEYKWMYLSDYEKFKDI